VVYDPDLKLVTDLVLCEDGHSQERALMGPIVQQARAGQVWLADRNFCTSAILWGFAKQQASFVIREHGASPNPKECGHLRKTGRIETGVVYEQLVEIENDEGEKLRMRRIQLHLDEPTEDGERVIRILTNLPKRISAKKLARLYRKRWTIENMFQRLESVLHSEIRSLGYPRAALLGFGVAVMAYNVLSVVQSAVEQRHNIAEEDELQLSSYFIANEIQGSYRGMLIAITQDIWQQYDALTAPQLVRLLLEVAGHVEPRRFRKHPRGPKAKVKKGYVSAATVRKHVATARVLKDGHV
jgi:IS4 transposase